MSLRRKKQIWRPADRWKRGPAGTTSVRFFSPPSIVSPPNYPSMLQPPLDLTPPSPARTDANSYQAMDPKANVSLPALSLYPPTRPEFCSSSQRDVVDG